MSAYFKINGGRPNLQGSIKVNGAKNAALKILASSLLFNTALEIKNVPLIEDVFRMNELLKKLGAQIQKQGNKSFVLSVNKEINPKLDQEIAKRFRASIVLSGPMLARFGEIKFPHPGGCVIGKRPIDIFLDSFKKLGAKIKENKEFYHIKAPRLAGTDIAFRIPSVTATETIMMAAIGAKGKTIIRNAACEPEIVALANFLNKNGASIEGAGTHTIKVKGLGAGFKGLNSKHSFTTPPDRIEAGTFLILGALLGKDIKVQNCNPKHLTSLLSHLAKAGVKHKKGKNWIQLSRPKKLKAVDIKTREYPGFPTDLQAPFAVLLTQAYGNSAVFETIFDSRLEYLADLERMGAKITKCDPHRAIVHGPTLLRGRKMESPDLRAGLAFVLAALAARGESKIYDIYHIDRGYEQIEKRLQTLGADIKRIA